ncbi:MAG: hypothetical protein DWQ36_16020 [Acidobacteria bacterium]|nr:MAG: hypothetical protein DWQ30_20425 [Acidobacteriota bacterium]REK05617.1 MAG: hypothetical protein DWQ36_16020 [Acidobacteriota bacterium]
MSDRALGKEELVERARKHAGRAAEGRRWPAVGGAVLVAGLCSLLPSPAGMSVLAAAGGAAAALAQRSSVQVERFEFSRLDRSYDSIVDELAPVQVGPATVLLRSPSHRLDLHGHQVELVRGSAGDGLGAVLTLDVSGSGLLEADVSLGTVRSQLADELVLPRQEIRVVGRISVARGEEGYLVRPLELPEQIEVRIESRLARQLFVICRPMTLVLVNMDCVELERSLSRIRVPLPAAGDAYLLPYAEVSEAERLAFERFLDG